MSLGLARERRPGRRRDHCGRWTGQGGGRVPRHCCAARTPARWSSASSPQAGRPRRSTGVATTNELVVCPKSRNASSTSSSSSTAGTCTLSRKQSSPEMRWHSLTCGVRRGQLGDLRQLAGAGPDAHPRGDRQPDRGRVDVEAVAADHAGPLEPADPLAHRGRGHADPARPAPPCSARGSSASARRIGRLISSRACRSAGRRAVWPSCSKASRAPFRRFGCAQGTVPSRIAAREPASAACVLRRQRGVPLPRAGVRGAAVRPRRRARRGLAADRLGRGDLRAVAPAVAGVALAGPRPRGGCSPAGARCSR